MNKKDKLVLLKIIEDLVPADNAYEVYHDTQNGKSHYYFYTGMSCKVQIDALGDNIVFTLKNEIAGKSRVTNDVLLNFEFHEVKPLLEKFFKNISQRRAEEYLVHTQIEYASITHHQDFINNYLKNTDLSQEFKKYGTSFKPIIENGASKYRLNLDDMYQEKPQHVNILSICTIGLRVEGQDNFSIQHMIPGWDIESYKGLEPLFKIENSPQDLNSFINAIEGVNPGMGTYLESRKLEHVLPEKEKKRAYKI